MVSVDELPEVQLKNLLQSKGVLEGYTIQLYEYEESKDGSESIAAILINGGESSGDEVVRRLSGSVYLFGAVGASPRIERMSGDNVLRAMLEVKSYSDIIGIGSSGIIGTFRTQSRRPVCEIPFNMIFSFS